MIYLQAVTKELSKAITQKKAQGLSKESPRLSKRMSLRFLGNVLKVILKGFRGD